MKTGVILIVELGLKANAQPKQSGRLVRIYKSDGDKMKTENARATLNKFRDHFPIFNQEWEDYQNGEMTKKELLSNWSDFCKNTCHMKIGKNNAFYLPLAKYTVKRPPTTTKDIVWVDGDRYDFVFIRLHRSTNLHIVEFMNILNTAKEEE